MRTSFVLAALATATAATGIVGRTGTPIGQESGEPYPEFKTNKRTYKESSYDKGDHVLSNIYFKWPRIPGDKNFYRCTATLISPQVAVTAANCVREWEKDNARLYRMRAKVAGQWRRITEIRVPECYDFTAQGPTGVDVALLILNKPIEKVIEVVEGQAQERDVVEGKDYAPVWVPTNFPLAADDIILKACNDGNPFLDFSPADRATRPCTVELSDEFIVAGYGSWQGWDLDEENHYDNQLNAGGKLLWGENIMSEFRHNSYYISMTNFGFEFGLPWHQNNEAGPDYGDVGGAALMLDQGATQEEPNRAAKLLTVGVARSIQRFRTQAGTLVRPWGSQAAYTRTDGDALQWILDNLADITRGGAVEATNLCEMWGPAGSSNYTPCDGGICWDLITGPSPALDLDIVLPGTSADPRGASMDYDDPPELGGANQQYFNCPCDCDRNEAANGECWAACDRCLGHAIM